MRNTYYRIVTKIDQEDEYRFKATTEKTFMVAIFILSEINIGVHNKVALHPLKWTLSTFSKSFPLFLQCNSHQFTTKFFVPKSLSVRRNNT